MVAVASVPVASPAAGGAVFDVVSVVPVAMGWVVTGLVVAVASVVAVEWIVTGEVTPTPDVPDTAAGPVPAVARGVSRCEPVESAPAETALVAATGFAEPLLPVPGDSPFALPAGRLDDPAELLDDAELSGEDVSAWATAGALANKIPAPAIAAPAPTQPNTDDAVSNPRRRFVTTSPVRLLGIGLGIGVRVVNEVPHQSGRSVSQASDEPGRNGHRRRE